jgi:Mn2+/Fe2+ NRAMP family transporter
VVALYFFPGSKYANSVGVFKAWEKSKGDPEIHNFVKYLVNWVAGTKLIFILLLIVILYTAGEQTLIFSNVALIIAIASFFWRLFPMIRRMDRDDQIDPKNYSAVLGWMILAFILVFLTATIIFVSR